MEYKVIKYGAKWCCQCKTQDREFKDKSLNCLLEIIDVDDLEEKEIEDLKVQSIPVTFLMKREDESSLWKEIKRWNGFVKSEEINKLIN